MPDKSVAEKLWMRPGKAVLVVNPPKELLDILGSTTPGIQFVEGTSAPADIILAFIGDRADLEQQLPYLQARITAEGALWIAYRKGTSKQRTDVNRDTIRALALTHGLEGVAMISIDQDWSALRLKVRSTGDA